MSVAEIQKEITALSPGKRRSVVKYIAHLKRQDSAARKRKLSRIMREMDAGKKNTMAQVEEASFSRKKVRSRF
jgi:hypothetical protein